LVLSTPQATKSSAVVAELTTATAAVLKTDGTGNTLGSPRA
jgi:hypothetical protein